MPRRRILLLLSPCQAVPFEYNEIEFGYDETVEVDEAFPSPFAIGNTLLLV